jgi:gliding motility-associated-like protein
MVPKVVTAVITPGLCGELPASVAVTLEVLPTQPRLTYEYVDDKGAILSSGPIIAEVPNPIPKLGVTIGGTYRLLVVNDDGCAVTLGSYELPTIQMSISQTESVVGNDRCNQQIGYVVPAIINGGRGGPGWTYTWTDVETGKVVGVSKTLSKIGAGTYNLVVVKPAEGCIASATFTVTNTSPALVPPIAEGTTSCLPSLINITVTNVDTSKLFRLYDSPTSTTPIDSSKTGVFYKQVDETTDFYVTRVSKDCESDRTKVTETVVVSIKIPNAFTPNGDGVNDTWAINGIDKFPGADLKIFTRYGKLIYHSIDYPVPFDGTNNGAPLPAGAYYYILDVKQPICYGKISGSITIIR